MQTDESHTEERDWIGTQSVRLTLDVGLAPFVAHVMTAWTVVGVFLYSAASWATVVWAMALSAVVIGQAGVVARYRDAVLSPDLAGRIRRIFLICGVLIGLCWSALFVLMFPRAEDYNAIYLAFVAGGLSMGAVATQHLLPWGVIAATCLSLSCLAVQFVISGFPNGYFHAFCVLLYAAVMVDLIFRLRRLALKASRLQIEQRRLQEQIANDRARRAQADERQRVARDMHDSVGQWLASVKLRLQTIGAEVGSGRNIDRERLAELIGDMDVLITDTRRIAHDLSPSIVAHKGLADAVRDHLKYLDEDHGLQLDLHLDDGIPLDSEAADHLYRIVQQATSNAVVHGQATQVMVRFAPRADGGLVLSIADNGIGFDAQAKPGTHTLGLASIRERAAMLGAVATVTSQPGQGTRVELTMPPPGA